MTVIDFSKIESTCESCNLAELCLPRGVEQADLERLDQVTRRIRLWQRNQALFRAGERLISLYAVRSGSVKLSTSTEEGEEQIIGFYLPGDILGLDGVERSEHTCTAVALETTSVCGFPYSKLTEMCQQVPGLQEQMLRLMGRELTHEHRLLLNIGKKGAEERVATFFVSLSSRYQRLGYSPCELRMSMSRQEVANYLGMTIETVSRTLGRFRKLGVLEADGRLITIHDMPALQRMCSVREDGELGRGSAQ